MSFSAKEGPRRCPVEVCLGFLTTSTAMRVHFVHQHVQDTVVMLEEGNLPLPQFFRCDLQVTRKALNGCHMGTLQCKKGGGAEAAMVGRDRDAGNTERAFHAYGKPMEAVS